MPPPSRGDNGAAGPGRLPGRAAPIAPPPPRDEPETGTENESGRGPGRFGRLAERLASAGRAEVERRRPASADDDDDDDGATRPPSNRPAPAGSSSPRSEPPRRKADDDDDGDAFVIRPRISARQASELTFDGERLRRFRPLLRVSPAHP